MVTIKDVARSAGVSVATVSRAINSSGYVHDVTKEKIDEAIKVLNYRPNETARSLYNRKSKIIGLLLPDMSNPFFTRIARGVEDTALHHGYHIIIGNSDQLVDKEARYIETFKVNNCAGFISSSLLMDNAESYIQSLNMAHVTLDRTDAMTYAIGANHLEGGRMQARHLVDRGCERVLVLSGDRKFNSFSSRVEGAVEVLREQCIDFELIEVNGSFNVEELVQVIASNYDGVICYNDLIAIQLLGMLQEKGIRVPQDVLVIGYDDIQLSEYTYPSLTTIRQPMYELGVIACKALIDLLDGKKVNRETVVDVNIVERNSTRSELNE